MTRLSFTRPNNLALLHDELLAAVPALRPTPNMEGRLEPVMTVEGNESTVWLTVPDGADQAAIAAVVAAHDHTAKQADPATGRKARIDELLAISRSNWTAAQQRELLELAAQSV